MKTDCYWLKNSDVDQWNQIEDLDINPQTYDHLIFDKKAKIIQWKKESVFNICAGITGCQTLEE